MPRRVCPVPPGRRTAHELHEPSGESCGTHMSPNFRSDHPGGGNFLFADGSVHFLHEDIDMLTYQQLSTIFGDEVVDVP